MSTQEPALPAEIEKEYPLKEITFADDGALDLNNLGAVGAFADLAHRSKLVPDAEGTAQVAMKLIIGKRMGLAPQECLNDLYINRGKIEVFAKGIIRRIEQTEKYDFKVRENTEKKCVVEFFRDGDSRGSVEKTIEQHERLLGSAPWKAAPARMLFYKCMTEGYYMYCSDIFNIPVGVKEDSEDGEYIEKQIQIVKNPNPEINKKVEEKAAARKSKKAKKEEEEATEVDEVQETEVEEVKAEEPEKSAQEKHLEKVKDERLKEADTLEAAIEVAEETGEKEKAEELRKKAAETKIVSTSDIIKLNQLGSKHGWSPSQVANYIIREYKLDAEEWNQQLDAEQYAEVFEHIQKNKPQ